ncbi:DNA-binding protein [Colletotrichum simmondsii]|uniref:DNA-binding protein n=1 Tax=Colletotrichum simmondsii TaxID=703756 RepID=A0A135RRW4_9PEZI|nr:DNA-binding protein [Colletotrichum simmondsii]
MVKAKEEVISEFNEYVNMTAEDLESWLKSDDSNSAGWPKDDAEGEGESVGHDSGRKIVEILQANPDKKEDEYTDEQVEHMRKVVAYCKRHLAQESKANSDKSPEEVKKSKSYASLKNWGHDFLKAQGKENGASKSNGKSTKKEENGDEEKAESNGSKKQNGPKKDEEEAEDDKEEEAADEEAEDESEEKAGDKRKNASEENGASKKRQTRQGEGKSTEKSDEKNGDDDKEEEAEEKDEDGDEEMEDDGDDKENGGGKAKKGPKKGDTVSWNWGSGQPEGKVLDVKGEKTSITTKRGNEVSRDGDPEDPAVVIDTGKSKAIKSAHELNE